MISFPILLRELLVASRRKRTFILRMVFGLFIAGAAGLFLVGQTLSRSQAMGHGLLVSFAWQMTILVFLLTPALTAGCLSDERRDGTLGLLFLTRLNAMDIVLGKFVGRTLDILLVVLSATPMLFVPILLGGVGWDQALAVLVCVCGALWLSSAIAIFCSATIRNTGTATVIAYFGLVAYNATVLVLPLFKKGNFTTRFVNDVVRLVPDWLAAASPFHALWRLNLPDALQTLLLCGGAGAALLALSIGHLPGAVRADGFREPFWRRLFRRRGVTPAARAPRVVDRRALDRDPLLWLFVGRHKNHRTVQLILGGLLILYIGAEWYAAPNHRDAYNTMMFFGGLFVAFLLKVLIVIHAARAFAPEKEDGSLELMLAMPFTNERIVRARLLAVMSRYGIVYGIVLLLVIAGGLGMLADMGHASLGSFLFGCYFVGTTITGLAWALCVALLISVWSRTVRQALTLSILVTLLVSWGIWQLTYLGVMVAGLFGVTARWNFFASHFNMYVLGALFVSVRMAIDLLIAYVAYRSLVARLRKLATR